MAAATLESTMHLYVERTYPVAVAALTTAAWASLCKVPTESLHDLFATSVSLAAIVVGFLATAMSIVLAAPDSRVMKQLRESGYVHDLVWYLREPFVIGLVLAALSLSGYLISPTAAKANLFVGALVFFSTLMLAGLFRISMVFMHYLKAAAFSQAGYSTPR
jgi:hypothetical protein